MVFKYATLLILAWDQYCYLRFQELVTQLLGCWESYWEIPLPGRIVLRLKMRTLRYCLYLYYCCLLVLHNWS